MKKKLLIAAFTVGIIGASVANADTIVSAGSLWEYTFTAPASDWLTNTGTPLGSTGYAPFGSDTAHARNPDFWPNTYWGVDGVIPGVDLWVRTTFNMAQWNPATVQWGLGADNGFNLYLNGNLIAQDFADGYAARWEYQGDFGNYLTSGINVLAVELRDYGVETAFDMEVTGALMPDLAPAAVPLPGAAAMGFLGMGFLGLVRRKKQTV